jgi:DNA polymerase elongation subunit (family B)
LELSVSEIRECWENEYKSTIEEYLGYDLDDTRLLADFLLPVVYYQMVYVPNLSFQQMAIASPALKAQKIHQEFSSGLYPDPIADKRLKYEGGRVELVTPGLHQNVGKIDVSSLYPSVMLRYGICSRKDTDNEFLGVLEFMRSERLRLKDLAKSGDKSASFQEKALKVLINGSYGFLGTGGYSFNDFEAAALVTAYGRKILSLMVDVVSSCGGIVIEIDTDGILFSHNEPKTVSRLVAESLPDGIDIELELSDCGLYAPKAKNYVIIHPNGETAVKGLYRKRDRYPLEKEFPIQFLKTYFTRSPELADKYYHQTRQRLIDRVVDVCELTVTKKIPASDKKLTALNLGKHGDRVSYWMTKHEVHHKKTGKLMRYEPRETTRESYWAEYYIDKLDEQYREILGINQVKPEKKSADRQLEP